MTPIHELSDIGPRQLLHALREDVRIQDFGEQQIGRLIDHDVHSLAGQIARRLGAARLIGTAGSGEKCRWLVDELGFDAAVDYHDDDLVGALRAVAPDGISVYLDLIGGVQFEAAVAVAAPRPHRRRWRAVDPAGGHAVAAPGHADRDHEGPDDSGLRLGIRAARAGCDWPALVGRWLAEGMVYPHTVFDGRLDAVPQALVDLLGGRHRGHVSVRVA